MKERPILFSGPMVRAILDGRKTQTRRPVKPQPIPFGLDNRPWMPVGGVHQDRWLCPIGQPGDRLWVRETWRQFDAGIECACYDECFCRRHRGKPIYRADCDSEDKWRPSIHMPRWASRITLEITRVWVERVQDITEEDAKAEGCCGGHSSIPGYAFSATPREHFRHIWQSIYGTWDANPWVWAVEFRRTK